MLGCGGKLVLRLPHEKGDRRVIAVNVETPHLNYFNARAAK